MNYTFYNPNTGEIIGIISTSDVDIAEQNLQDKTWIEGYYDPGQYYISNGQAIEKSIQPKDGHVYQYNISNNTWTINVEQENIMIRKLRDTQLSQIDRVNPVWYAALTTEQQQELQVYRQALLDVPQQSGFPTDTVWPSKPTWL